MLLKDERAESAEEDDSDADEEDLDEEEADSSSADADADADEEERTETRSEAEVEDAESVLVPLLVVEGLSIRGRRDGRCGSCCRRCWRRESALEVEV